MNGGGGGGSIRSGPECRIGGGGASFRDWQANQFCLSLKAI